MGETRGERGEKIEEGEWDTKNKVESRKKRKNIGKENNTDQEEEGKKRTKRGKEKGAEI